MEIYPKSKESGVQNMATDWWLFENADKPSFRHYKWTSSETSFGYGQDWKWVEEVTSLSVSELIRDRLEEESSGMARIGLIASFYQENILHLKSPLDLYKAVHGCVGKL